MSKTKSVVMTVILTIVIVILCLMCVVPEFTIPFRVGGIWTRYNSVLSVINYGSDLGGGYSAVYYPEGVISAEEYSAQAETYEGNLEEALRKFYGDDETPADELLADYEENGDFDAKVEQAVYDRDEYLGTYVAYTSANFPALEGVSEPAVYLDVDEVCAFAEGSTDRYVLSDEFKEDFERAVEIMADRFDKKVLSFLNVSVKDGCTIQVSVPYTVSDPDLLFEQLGYAGEFTLRANEEITSRPLLRPFGEHTMADYFRGASSMTSGGAGIVVLELTDLGRDTIYNITNELRTNETDATLYFYVGDTQLIGLGLSDEDDGLDLRTLYISGSTDNPIEPEEAENMAIVLDSCIEQGTMNMRFSAGSTVDYSVGSGEWAVTAFYIVFGAVMLAAFVFFLVRYRGLGLAHVFAFLSYLICMIMFVAFLPGMLLTASGLAAVVLGAVVATLSNIFIFENIRREFATGKTLDSAIKAGYKRSLAPVLDTHILLFLLALVLFFISVSEVTMFCYVFLLAALTSGVSALLLTRYYAYILRGLVDRSRQYKFYGFKREVSDDDEE